MEPKYGGKFESESKDDGSNASTDFVLEETGKGTISSHKCPLFNEYMSHSRCVRLTGLSSNPINLEYNVTNCHIIYDNTKRVSSLYHEVDELFCPGT